MGAARKGGGRNHRVVCGFGGAPGEGEEGGGLTNRPTAPRSRVAYYATSGGIGTTPEAAPEAVSWGARAECEEK